MCHVQTQRHSGTHTRTYTQADTYKHPHKHTHRTYTPHTHHTQTLANTNHVLNVYYLSHSVRKDGLPAYLETLGLYQFQILPLKLHVLVIIK